MDNDKPSELSIAQLRTFRLVMREGGYAAAAKKSNLSVPSMWQHVRSLEKTYNMRLFERSGRHVTPTEEAKKLYQQVECILVQLESTFEIASNSAQDQPLRLVTGVRMLLEDLATPLARFQCEHSNRLIILHGNDSRATDLLLNDEADIGLALEPGHKQSSELIHYEPAYAVEFLAIAKKNHPYMSDETATLQDLAKHNLVVTAAGTHGRDALDQAFHREGLSANIVVETDNSAFTIACVSSGMGVGIVAGLRDGKLTKSLKTRSLSKELGRRRIVLMWRKGRLLTEPMLMLIEQIMKINPEKPPQPAEVVAT